MKIIGIICEYNPFHTGHETQFSVIRARFPDAVIVSLMSGNYVQRGAPAVIDKSLRAKAALVCGADLVLELPITCALSSAEQFASGAVRILSPICTHLCFGCETADIERLMQTASALLDNEFSIHLRQELSRGISFPAARAAALNEMGLDSSLLERPNDILAVEYCKAILTQDAPIIPFPIPRAGSYHAKTAEPEHPSATAVRSLMLAGLPYEAFVPAPAARIFSDSVLHDLSFGEKAILARLRTMTDAQFESLPYGSEGLWRKLMHTSRSEATLAQIIAATKSKRYTRTRIDRMILCAFLGITDDMLRTEPPYTRVLAFNDRGRTVLKQAKQSALFLNAGERTSHPYWDLEQRSGALYGLFCADTPEPPTAEKSARIYYQGDKT